MEFNEMLDMNDPDFAEKFKKALGLEESQGLEITTPTFNRKDNLAITYFPKTIKEYQTLKQLNSESLKALGLQKWNSEKGITLWLFPAEWYEHIPAGLKIIDINYKEEEFIPGITDDDRRFGALAFGFTQNNYEVANET